MPVRGLTAVLGDSSTFDRLFGDTMRWALGESLAALLRRLGEVSIGAVDMNATFLGLRCGELAPVSDSCIISAMGNFGMTGGVAGWCVLMRGVDGADWAFLTGSLSPSDEFGEFIATVDTGGVGAGWLMRSLLSMLTIYPRR